MEVSKSNAIKRSAILQREDFDAGPLNLDCIEPGLLIGKFGFIE